MELRWTSLWVCLLLLAGCGHPDRQATRELFNDGWRFQRIEEGVSDESYPEPGLDDAAWEVVSLPHTARIEPLLVNDQWQGTCWYRKSFTAPARWAGNRIWLEFEGAMNVADVWVNGTYLMQHMGGYLPFVADITEMVRWGEENLVAVRLDNRDNPITGPKPLDQLDFNMYSGLYRNVWLHVKPPLHITHPVMAGLEAGGGLFVTTPSVSKQQAVIAVQTNVVNQQEQAARFRITHELYLGDSLAGAVEGVEEELAAEAGEHLSNQILVKDPLLWSPSHPHLYRLVTTLSSGNKILESQELRIGIKKVEFNGQTLLLNGEPIFLRGVNRHQEYPYIGYALSDRAQYRDALKIKEAGFDYVRLSHYPHSIAFMDACDELGIVTIDAILGWQYYSREEAFRSHVFQTARDLIRRDRNHVSVLAWEVSLNESWMPPDFIDSLNRIAHLEVPGPRTYSAGWQPNGFDIYLQARQHRLHTPPFSGEKPYVVSEYGDWEYYAMNAGLNQDDWGDLLEEERTSRQLRGEGEARLMQQARNIQEAHNDNFNTPACADGYWVMFDYNRGYADDLESSGIMDIFRIPKPSTYFFRSQRDAGEPRGDTVLYIVNIEPFGEKGVIRIFSNCDEVELLADGESLGRKQPDRDRFSDHLAHPPFTFQTGNRRIGALVAKGFLDGTEVAVTEKRTPGEAVSIRLKADTRGAPLKSGCKDRVFIYAFLCDANGTVVSFNGKEVQFEVSGNARLTGANPAPSEAGIASILLEAGEDPGMVKVTARSAGLETGELELESVR
ncbi:MAG: glycoside hydrolase family 2 protein [Bacteroidales bacterium]